MKGYHAIVAVFMLVAGIILQQPAFGKRALYDDFEGPAYAFESGKTSPNGKWLSVYGPAGTAAKASGNMVIFEKPQAPSKVNETHAALVLSTAKYKDVDIFLKVMTKEQLRKSSPPNAWEAAWVMWRYQDSWHHYYFVLKPNGIELGKKQNDIQSEEQVFLFTAKEPRLATGTGSEWNIRMAGNHIEVWLNTGAGWDKVVDYYDDNQIAGQGSVGLYTEDAHVEFDDVYLTVAR